MKSYEAVARSLWEARPDGLLEAAHAALAKHYGAVGIDLLLVDYGMTMLCHVGDPPGGDEPQPVFTSLVGRVFGSQTPMTEERSGRGTVVLHLPVSVRGDRLGVLTVEIPGHSLSEEIQEELRCVAEDTGRALLLAERDTDIYRTARRRDRLTLAAEMQWDLLAGRSYEGPEFSIGAQLEPAYAIRGDNFDWSVAEGRLNLSITNGMGEGIDASLLTNLTVNALRNARRSGIPLADQAALADKAVHAQHAGERYVEVLLLSFDVPTGRVEVVDAGSPRLYVLREDQVFRWPFEAQIPVGMAEDTVYTAEYFDVRPGDRLVFVSDGVSDALGRTGEAFGERALSRAITATKLLNAASVPQEVLRHLAAHREGSPIEDDSLVVCVDWRGQSRRRT